MIDNAFWVATICLAIIGICLIYASATKGKANRFAPGVTLFLLALFMTGAEMVTGSEAPWAYLVLSGSETDWSKAFFGGVMLLMLPIILLAVGGKDLAKLIDQKS